MAQSSSPLRTAICGFVITAAFVRYQLLTGLESPVSRSPALMLLFIVLCPPSLLSLAFNSVEAGTSNFYVLWTAIGVLNGALYGSLRLLLQRRAGKVR
jgi:multidrug transporter EmrE-like cation transporter